MPSPPQLSDSSHRLLWKLAVCACDDSGGGGAGVSSFNGRTGAVVLTFADVADALGCEPECVANKSTDGTFAANSDVLYPSQKAAKTYADTKLALTGGILTGDLDISTGIHLDTTGDAQFDGQVTAERLLLTGATFAIGTERLIDAAVTWAGPGQTFTAWKLNVTNTFSNVGSLLLDLQVDAISVFSVNRAGNFVAAGTGSITGALDAAGGQYLFNTDGSATFNAGATPIAILVDGSISMAGGATVLTSTGMIDLGASALVLSSDGSASFATGAAAFNTSGDLSFNGPVPHVILHTDDTQTLALQVGGGAGAPGITLSGEFSASSGSIFIEAGVPAGSVFIRAGGAELSLDPAGTMLFTGGTEVIFQVPLRMSSNFITDVLDPVNPQDAATKAYVDASIGGPFQPLDADLTAISALATTGILARTGAGTYATRTITGTVNQVIVVNGDGVAGNPTFSLPQNIHTAATPQFQRLGLGAAASATHQLLLSGGTITTDDHQIDGAVTWNAGAVTFTGWKLNVTNTASAAASKLIDLQVGGAARFNVTVAGLGVFQAGATLTTGNLTVTTGNIAMTAGNIDFSGTSPTIYQTNVANSLRLGFAGSGPLFQFFGNSNGSFPGMAFFDGGSGDMIFRFASGLANNFVLRFAGLTEVVNGAVTTGGFYVYNTRTSATNFERMSHNWSGNVARIWTEKGSGGGTARALVLGADATELMRFGSSTTLSFFAATAVVKQTSGANLTNSVTAGGTDDTIANYTDLVVYANDAAAIRNDIYQLARKLKQVNDGLRAYGLLT